MKRLIVLASALFLCALGCPVASAESLVAVPQRPASCVDTPLRLSFSVPPQLGTSGRIEVHRADGTVADSIDMADPASNLRTIGDGVSDTGLTHQWHYYPVIVAGNTASIYLHHQLDYGQAYYVTVDPGVFTGFAGIQDPRAWRFSTRPFAPRPGSRVVTVSANGHGDFCTVQGAIDFVPHNNTRPVLIDVRAGTYTEIDYVRADRPHITVRGESRTRTVIQYANNDALNGDHALSNGGPSDVCPLQALPGHDTHNCWRAMFGDDAPDFTLENITLRNTTPYGGSQAEAFRGNNDRITLDHVNLLGYQDTLRLQGKGFVTDSYIAGDVDFIWGSGAIFVQDSELRALHNGYYTEIRNDASHGGAVFVRDRLTRTADVPDGSVLLGRISLQDWPYSQDVFIDSAMDAHIDAAGWQVYNGDCTTATHLQFAEYHSTDLSGNPIDTSGRLACSRQLTAAEAAQLQDPQFVLGGWDPPAAHHGGDAE